MTTRSSLESWEVRNAARGAWLTVLGALAPELEAALARPGRHVPCPVHGGRDGFRLYPDAEKTGGGICNTCGAYPDGFSLLMWLKGWRFPDALEAVANVLGLVGTKPVMPVRRRPATRPVVKTDDARAREVLRAIWRAARPVDHPDAEPLRRYLAHRGLAVRVSDLTHLKYHPALQYWTEDGRLVGVFPAMLGLVLSSASEPVTIHRTFLTPDGRKAPVESPKKLMPVPDGKRLSGAAIRLGVPGSVLGVTEGIETALAVQEATGLPTWATLNAALMKSFEPPEGVDKLLIWADNDPVRNGKKAGLDAAEALRKRMSDRGLETEILLPEGFRLTEGKGVDWLDVLVTQGPAGFPFSRLADRCAA
ncbi:toprim domain-containing protein [Methylocaldum szegediense]|uniref:DUF7146 domain-containing protein n=1 Tax=Methylocaldum szegediense TaxID=73780 RepID=UPI0003FF8C01|nr:toprim domain-containing protein [Methylocaldum szegediense]